MNNATPNDDDDITAWICPICAWEFEPVGDSAMVDAANIALHGPEAEVKIQEDFERDKTVFFRHAKTHGPDEWIPYIANLQMIMQRLTYALIETVGLDRTTEIFEGKS